MNTMIRMGVVALLLTLSSASMAGPRAVDARQHRQEARIEQGVYSGALTGREQARLYARQAHISGMERRAGADGVYNLRERARLEQALNRSSRAIARQKHDRQYRH